MSFIASLFGVKKPKQSMQEAALKHRGQKNTAKGLATLDKIRDPYQASLGNDLSNLKMAASRRNNMNALASALPKASNPYQLMAMHSQASAGNLAAQTAANAQAKGQHLTNNLNAMNTFSRLGDGVAASNAYIGNSINKTAADALNSRANGIAGMLGATGVITGDYIKDNNITFDQAMSKIKGWF